MYDFHVDRELKKYYMIQEYCEGGSLKDFSKLDY